MPDNRPIQEGDRIRHKLAPDFAMEVLEVAPCEGLLPGVAAPHDRYRIVGPDGRESWLCAHQVERTS